MSTPKKMDLSKIEALYTNNLEQFGLDSRSVGWNSSGSQHLRFEKLLYGIDAFENFTLNELGCGYGELYKHLVDNKYHIRLYNGYDISLPMLEEAKRYIGEGNVAFHHRSDIITEADYTITSGIFNVKFEEDQSNWEGYIQDTLKQMYANSKRGIAFNLLTTYVDFESKGLYYGNPVHYFNFCKKELSRYVTLVHDYNLYEWTIIVKR